MGTDSENEEEVELFEGILLWYKTKHKGGGLTIRLLEKVCGFGLCV